MLKTREFARWASREGLTDAALAKASAEVMEGLVDAQLGGAVCKKRIALPGRGKRGSVRTLIAYRDGQRLVYLFGFAKNERDNINPLELAALKRLASHLLSLTDAGIRRAIRAGELQEITP